ncbi:MAG: protoporphyrinogen oxidase HemJ [Rhodospirillales bacterium]
MDYLWLKALHVISVIAWMAGLLYLPRLFVYHAAEPPGSATAAIFKVMERRLFYYIMVPAMVATYVFGIWMIVELGSAAWTMGWLHGKLALVLLLTVLHEMMGRWRRQFAQDDNQHSQTFFRVVNEAPTLLMIGIVILAILKPF